jgi:hypothetical protein
MGDKVDPSRAVSSTRVQARSAFPYDWPSTSHHLIEPLAWPADCPRRLAPDRPSNFDIVDGDGTHPIASNSSYQARSSPRSKTDTPSSCYVAIRFCSSLSSSRDTSRDLWLRPASAPVSHCPASIAPCSMLTASPSHGLPEEGHQGTCDPMNAMGGWSGTCRQGCLSMPLMTITLTL